MAKEESNIYEGARTRATQRWECGDITREALEYIFPKLQEQKSTEWSADDEKVFKRICELVHEAAFSNCETNDVGEEVGEYWKMMCLLKELKERYIWNISKEQETFCDKCKKAQPSHSCQDITALGRCAVEQADALIEELKKK